MKKAVAIIIISVMLFSVAYADIDLSTMSYEELLNLRDKITEEIVSRPEWKGTTVPAGEWIVGEDIPVGSYSISPINGGSYLKIYDEAGDLIVYGGIRDESDAIGKVKLKEGYTVQLKDGTLVFAPAISLGF